MKTADERIDAALDSVLKASGSALKHYTMAKTLADMREAMRKVMAGSYIEGSNDNFEAMMKNVEIERRVASARMRVRPVLTGD